MGRVQSWKRKTIKQHLLSSIWDQLSNRSAYTQTVPKSKEKVIPSTVVHKVSDSFNEGTYQTTCLWVGRPQFKPVAGPNKAEGKERKLITRTKTINYNVQRFPITLNDRSVGGDISKFYKMAERVSDVIKDLFVESTDYDHERALHEGSDEWLTESEFWEDSENGSDITTPKTKVLHPNMYSDATSGKVTWSPTYATTETNLLADIDNLAATNTFDLGALDRIHLIATRTIVPLGGYSGNTEVKWILKLSDAQWNQLTSDVAAGSFRDLLKYTEKGFDTMLHGHVGVYKNMLIVVSQRSPVYNLAGTAGSRFQYVTSAGDDRTRSETTGAGNADGTAEIAALMGNGTLALAIIEEVDYVRKGFDYDFSTGMTGTRSRGTERMDLDNGSTSAPTVNRINESSFLYFTSTTTAVA
jgi:hypothetical protein